MAKYDLENAIVHALNEASKDYGTQVQFDFTSKRASAQVLKKAAGVDRIKITMKNAKPFLQVMMYKNFTDSMGGWQPMLNDMNKKVTAAMKKAGIGVLYDVANDESLDKSKLKSVEEDDRISPESQLSLQLSEIAVELMLGDFDELEQSGVLKKFMLAMRSGDAVLFPESTWKSAGFAKVAAGLRITTYKQDLSSKIIAVFRPELEKICQSMNVLMTEDSQKKVENVTQQVNSKLLPLTPRMNEEILNRTKELTSNITLMKQQLEMFENPDKGYAKLLAIKNGVKDKKTGAWIQEPSTLTDAENRTLNVLTAVVEKNMLSLLNKKKADLSTSIASLTAKRNAVEAEVRSTSSASAAASEGENQKDILHILRQKAGNYKYYLAMHFNGQELKF